MSSSAHPSTRISGFCPTTPCSTLSKVPKDPSCPCQCPYLSLPGSRTHPVLRSPHPHLVSQAAVACPPLPSPPWATSPTWMFQFPSTSAPSGAHHAQRRVGAPGLSPALSSSTQLQPPAPPCRSAPHSLPRSSQARILLLSVQLQAPPQKAFPDCCVQAPLPTQSHTLTD